MSKRSSRFSTASLSSYLLILGTLAVVAHAAGLAGPFGDSIFTLVGAAALASAITGLVRNKPSLRWSWTMMCLAMVLFLVGGAVREALGTVGNITGSRSLTPDVITMLGYGSLYVSFIGIGRVRRLR
jgi:hypothetical protein